MPKIPLPSVQLQGGPQGQGIPAPAPPAQFADARPKHIQEVGAALSEAAKAAMGIASIVKSDRDAARSKEAYNEAMGFASELLTNPETGFLSTKKGKAATGAARELVLKQLQQKRDDLMKGLDNPVQRGRFAEGFDRAFIGIKEKVYGHEVEQRRVYLEAQTEEMADRSFDMAVEIWVDGEVPKDIVSGAEMAARNENSEQGPGGGRRLDANPEEVQRLIAMGYGEREARELVGISTEPPSDPRAYFKMLKNTGIDQVNELAQLRGIEKGSAAHEALLRSKLTTLHSGIVRKLLATGQAAQARQYLDGVESDELTTEESIRLEAMLRDGELNDSALRNADGLIRKTVTDSGSSDPVGDELRAQPLGERNTSQLLANAHGELMRRFRLPPSDPEHLTAEEMRRTYAFVAEEYARQKALFDDGAAEAIDEFNAWMAEPANRGMTVNSPLFPAELRQKLKDYGKFDDAAKVSPEGFRQTDPATWFEFVDMFDKGKLQGMSRSELTKLFYLRTDGPTFQRIEAAWAAANDTDAARKRNLSFVDNILTDKQRMNVLLYDMRLIADPVVGPDGSTEQQKALLFQQKLAERLQFDAGQGVKLDWDYARGVAARMVGDTVRVAESDIGIDWLDWDDQYPLFLLDEETKQLAYVDLPNGRRIKWPSLNNDLIIDDLKLSRAVDPLAAKQEYDAATTREEKRAVLARHGVLTYRPSAVEIAQEVDRERANLGLYDDPESPENKEKRANELRMREVFHATETLRWRREQFEREQREGKK